MNKERYLMILHNRRDSLQYLQQQGVEYCTTDIIRINFIIFLDTVYIDSRMIFVSLITLLNTLSNPISL